MENSIDMLNGSLQKNAPYLPDFIIRFVRGNDSSAVAVLSAGVGGFHPEEIDMSCARIMPILLFEPICAFYEIPAAAMRGLGCSALPAVETVIGTCLFRIVWMFTFFEHFGTLQRLYIVFPITWVVTSAAVAVSCAVVMGKRMNR